MSLLRYAASFLSLLGAIIGYADSSSPGVHKDVVQQVTWSENFATALSELKTGQGLLLIDTHAKRRVSAWRLRKNQPVIVPGLGRRFRLLALPAGEYHWQSIEVPYFDLPYKSTLSDDARFGFNIHAGKLNYFGSLVVGEARSRGSIDVRLLNRSTEVLELLSQHQATLLEQLPLVYSGDIPDDFLSRYARQPVGAK